jgi:hypothetical protein
VIDHYRKRGAVVRYENGALVRVNECGEAWFDHDRVFRAQPFAGTRLPDPDARPVLECAAAIRACVPSTVGIERLVVTSGVADHDCEGRTWSEVAARVHVTLTRGHQRVQLDLAQFDVAAVQPVAAAMASLVDGEAPRSFRVSPMVGASIVPLLLGETTGPVRVAQRGIGLDGRGLAVEEGAASAPWPNVWRPSYRVRPIAAPMHLVATHDEVSGIDLDLPCAIALLEPAVSRRLRLLFQHGTRSWTGAFVLGSVRSIGPSQEWYPVHAGSFGAEMVL